MFDFLFLAGADDRVGGSPTRTRARALILREGLAQLGRLGEQLLDETVEERRGRGPQGDFGPCAVVVGDRVPIQSGGELLDLRDLRVPSIVTFPAAEERGFLGDITPDLLQGSPILFAPLLDERFLLFLVVGLDLLQGELRVIADFVGDPFDLLPFFRHRVETHPVAVIHPAGHVDE